MIVGGEQVRPNVLQKWLKVAPNVRWLNGYGPTEATITSTLFEAKAGNWDGEVPIGRATAHARVFVLAPDGSLAPMGAPGQLVLGGQAVAMGYVDRREQTDAVLIPTGFGPFFPPMISPPLGPLSVLCVVLVTTSQ